MAYEPNEWSCGDTVTAEKLNAMERGISDMNADYVPTEWVCGDVITAEKLNHMEQGIANGCEGGGSSDFSTATVTFICNASDMINIHLCIAEEADPPFVPTAQSSIGLELGDGDESTMNAILYKGTCRCTWEGIHTVSGTGHVSIDTFGATITGDCTITIS